MKHLGVRDVACRLCAELAKHADDKRALDQDQRDKAESAAPRA
jgi:hypothetical protein